MNEKQRPWWEEVPAGGDVIVVQMGDYAHKVAAGKDVRLVTHEVLEEATGEDYHAVETSLAELRAQLAKVEGLELAQRVLAEDRVQTLEEELTSQDKPPEVSRVSKAVDWLLDNIPDIAEALLSLFASPAVGRIIGKAGTAGIEWAQKRFGSKGTA